MRAVSGSPLADHLSRLKRCGTSSHRSLVKKSRTRESGYRAHSSSSKKSRGKRRFLCIKVSGLPAGEISFAYR